MGKTLRMDVLNGFNELVEVGSSELFVFVNVDIFDKINEISIRGEFKEKA